MTNVNQKNSKSKKVSQSFAAGAIIMAVGMLLVRVAGAAFKIPLAYILEGIGSGYFSSAYSIYNPIYALATAGLPIAISRMVSGDMTLGRYKDVKMIHKVSIPMFVFTGLSGFILMILGSFAYVKFTNTPDSIYSIFMLAPTVVFACLISTYKGYYEGLRNMIPTAVSEIVEAVGKVVFGPTLAYAAVKCGMDEYKKYGTVFGKVCENETAAHNATLPWASAGAVLGITLGAVCGFIYIFIKYKISGDGITEDELKNSEDARPKKTLIKMLLNISVPIALGAIVMNLAGTIDTMLVQRRLYDLMTTVPDVLLDMYSGFIPSQAVENGTTHVFLNGCFVYMNNITMLLPTITQGLAISALPNVTASWVNGVKDKIEKNIETILKMTSVISFPIGLGMSVMAYPIMDLIYNTFGKSGQVGEICIASRIMSVYAIGIIFMSISTPLCSMLQAVGRADLPLKVLTAGMIIKIGLNYVLVGIPEINVQGAGIGTLVCYLFVCMSSIILLCKETKIKFNWISVVLKPALCGLMCAAAAYSSHGFLARVINFKLATILSIAIAGMVYILALLLSRCLSYSDLSTVPGCKKIVKVLEKYRLLG